MVPRSQRSDLLARTSAMPEEVPILAPELVTRRTRSRSMHGSPMARSQRTARRRSRARGASGERGDPRLRRPSRRQCDASGQQSLRVGRRHRQKVSPTRRWPDTPAFAPGPRRTKPVKGAPDAWPGSPLGLVSAAPRTKHPGRPGVAGNASWDRRCGRSKSRYKRSALE